MTAYANMLTWSCHLRVGMDPASKQWHYSISPSLCIESPFSSDGPATFHNPTACVWRVGGQTQFVLIPPIVLHAEIPSRPNTDKLHVNQEGSLIFLVTGPSTLEMSRNKNRMSSQTPSIYVSRNKRVSVFKVGVDLSVLSVSVGPDIFGLEQSKGQHFTQRYK